MDKTTSAIRHIAVQAVGFIVAFFATQFNVDISEASPLLVLGLAQVFMIVYYVGIRWLASFPQLAFLERLFVIPKSPVYVPPEKVEETQRTIELKRLR